MSWTHINLYFRGISKVNQNSIWAYHRNYNLFMKIFKYKNLNLMNKLKSICYLGKARGSIENVNDI